MHGIWAPKCDPFEFGASRKTQKRQIPVLFGPIIHGLKPNEQYFKVFERLRPNSARDRISRNRESTLTLSFLDPNEHDSLNILSPVRVIS